MLCEYVFTRFPFFFFSFPEHSFQHDVSGRSCFRMMSSGDAPNKSTKSRKRITVASHPVAGACGLRVALPPEFPSGNPTNTWVNPHGVPGLQLPQEKIPTIIVAAGSSG